MSEPTPQDALSRALPLIERLVSFDTESSKSNLPLIEFIEDYLGKLDVPFVRWDAENISGFWVRRSKSLSLRKAHSFRCSYGGFPLPRKSSSIWRISRTTRSGRARRAGHRGVSSVTTPRTASRALSSQLPRFV